MFCVWGEGGGEGVVKEERLGSCVYMGGRGDRGGVKVERSFT